MSPDDTTDEEEIEDAPSEVPNLIGIRLTAAELEELALFLDSGDEGDLFAWLNLETGDIECATSVYDLEDGPEEATPENVVPLRPPADWQRAERERVAYILDHTPEKFRRIPIGSAPPLRLREFLDTVTDPDLRALVSEAMRGKGAVRRVRDLLERSNKASLWYDFQAKRWREIVGDWLRREGLRLIG